MNSWDILRKPFEICMIMAGLCFLGGMHLNWSQGAIFVCGGGFILFLLAATIYLVMMMFIGATLRYFERDKPKRKNDNG